MKLTPCLNFINILIAAFLHKSVLRSSYVLTVWVFIFFLVKGNWRKIYLLNVGEIDPLLTKTKNKIFSHALFISRILIEVRPLFYMFIKIMITWIGLRSI